VREVNKWNDAEFVKNWCKTQGDYGDISRKALINPIIKELALLISNKENIDERLIVDRFINNQSKTLHNVGRGNWDTKLIKWHSNFKKEKSFKNDINILDLGCGEGYLGRWLTSVKKIKYSGYDISELLISEAKKKSGISSNCKYSVLNLEKDFNNIKDIRLNIPNAPLLMVMVNVIEHTEDPVKYLKMLSEKFPKSYFVLFTLNEEYFDIKAKEIIKRHDEISEVEIEGVGKIEVRFRHKRIVDEILRNARFQVIQSAPIYFPFKHENHTINPFNCFICRSLPSKQELSESDRTSIMSIFKNANGGSTNSDIKINREEISKYYFEEIEKLEFHKNETVISSNSIGGDLWVINNGVLKLENDIEPIYFEEKNEILGEFEIRESTVKNYGYYLYPVKSITDKAVVFRIPSNIVEKIFSINSQNMGDKLFTSLKSRLREVIWSYVTPKCKSLNANNKKHIGNHKLMQFVARDLLSRLETESNYRDPSRRCVFVEMDVLHILDGKRKGSASEFHKAFIFFRFLGAIDTWVISKKSGMTIGKYYDENKDLILNTLKNNEVEIELNDLTWNTVFGAMIRNWSKKTIIRKSECLIRDCENDYVRGLDNLKQYPKAASMFVKLTTYFSRLHILLNEEKGLTFFVVRDEGILRSIMLEDSVNINDRIQERIKALNAPILKEFDKRVVDKQITNYVNHFKRFIKTDLYIKKTGKLAFSKTSNGYKLKLQGDPIGVSKEQVKL